MSVFEIVRGVEGDCLVLDGTRICGPKPWGGGRIIKTFHTDGIYEVIDKDEYHKLQAENAKLREPVARVERARRDLCDAYPDAELLNCEECPAWSECKGDLMDRMRELGVEVDA